MSIEVFRPEPTLADLTVTINEEYRLANASAWDTVRHAIACGEALAEARKQVPDGSWNKWCADNIEMSRTKSQTYMRLALYRDMVLIPGGPSTLEAAIGYLHELKAPSRPHDKNGQRYPSFDVERAQELHAQGMGYGKIAAVLGTSRFGVECELKPGYKEQRKQRHDASRRRRLAEKKALAAKERDEAVKKHGGKPDEAYVLLRRCALVVDGAIIEVDDAEYREWMRTALAHVHKAEDAIVKALRIGRTS